MKEELKKQFSSCTDLKDKDGNILGAVCVATGKDLGKKDIILMPKDGDTRSVRSTTELINKLADINVPFEERKRVVDFTADRLRALELEEISERFKISPLGAKQSKKTKGEIK